MLKTRKRHELRSDDLRAKEPPTLGTRERHDLLGEDPRARATAGKALYRQFNLRIQSSVGSKLRGRYGALTCDIIQEAWLKSLEEMYARKDEFLKSRGERESVTKVLNECTDRALWRLQKRAQRDQSRLVSLNVEVHGASNRSAAGPGPDPVMTLSQIQATLEKAWPTLLGCASSVDRGLLTAIGPVAFFRGNWESASGTPQSDAEVATVVRLRAEARDLVRQILVNDYAVKASQQGMFLDALLPFQPSERPLASE